eukprot:TRINITY_DN25911_c0_g1_i1.p1 TRINITY_DN25911_c0_g1~~TRINITY_DN25911_c0_g1_i1.p1  ORF type:complete len:1272 (-),score=297.47 TRINITY_DN25911_c0_g1_i1:88-3750(-)
MQTPTIREVPSEAFPSLADALVVEGNAAPSTAALVIRLAAGEYREPLQLLTAALAGHGLTDVVIEAAAADESSCDDLPTLRALGPSGVEIAAGLDGSGEQPQQCHVRLRKLRLCAEEGGNALSIDGASPCVEDCELLGAGGAPARGARAGVSIRGASAQPVLRGCRIHGHSGAGVSIDAGASGVYAGNEISRCGCGFWLESGAGAALLWRNTVRGNSGAGVVARTGAQGSVLGNSLLGNACGALLESDRSAHVVLAHNRICDNLGPGLRQSKATALRAMEAGALILDNVIEDNGAGAAAQPMWQGRPVSTATELDAAVREAPVDRCFVVEISGLIELPRPLILDRPVLLVGSASGRTAGIACASGAAVVVGAGGASAALIGLRLQGGGAAAASGDGSCCVAVDAGRPLLLRCDLDARAADVALRVRGAAAAPLLLCCSVSGARRHAIVVEEGASATLVRCEVSGAAAAGLRVGARATAVVEESRVRNSGGFGVLVDAAAGRASLGCSEVAENALGAAKVAAGNSTAVATVQLERCTLALRESTPALAVGCRSRAMWRRSSLSHAAADAPEALQLLQVAGEADGGASSSTAAAGLSLGAGALLPGAFRMLVPECASGSSLLELSAASANGACAADAAASSVLPGWCEAGSVLGCGAAPGYAALEARSASKAGGLGGFGASSGGGAGASAAGAAAGAPTGVGAATAGANAGSEDCADEAQDEPARWLRRHVASGALPRWEPEDRQTLYGFVAMLAKRARCPELVSLVGLAGPICSGEVVHIRGHVGRYIGLARDANQEVLQGPMTCSATTRNSDVELIVMNTSQQRAGVLQRGATVSFEVVGSGRENLLISAEAGTHAPVCALPAGIGEQAFKIVARGDSVDSGAQVYLRAVKSRRLLEVSGDGVRAGGPAPVASCEFSLDKVPPPAMVPSACPERDLSLRDQAWILRRGVQRALVEKQHLARLLSDAKAPAPALLEAFTSLWESEWRSGALRDALRHAEGLQAARTALSATNGEGGSAGAGADAGGSGAFQPGPRTAGAAAGAAAGGADAAGSSAATASGTSAQASAAPAAAAPAESEALAKIRRLVRREVVAPTERANGDLFVKALRSFFADALQVSQLEANNVMRVVEAFAAALAGDQLFVRVFTPSMLPEEERRTYRTPEEIFFGLAYTTMMLNTDAHSRQVANKTWDLRKFVAAGRECGVQGALMTQIYKRVTECEL